MSLADGALAIGVLLGVRHALDPDHLAAVTVLATEHPGVRRGAWLGASWGAGHGVALLAVGLALAVFDGALAPWVADVFELAVAVMLVALGMRALAQSLRGGARGVTREHAHGSRSHAHPSSLPHVHLGSLPLARRPLLVGMVHGLAGSGALTALAVARLPSVSARVAFLALFGVGAVLGMTALSGAAGLPLARLARRPALARGVAAACGAAAALFGAYWAWPVLARLASG
jgi:hypothetical protein